MVPMNFPGAQVSPAMAISSMGSDFSVLCMAAEGGLEGFFYERRESEAESDGNCCRYIW
jgi:hypothetical protein